MLHPTMLRYAALEYCDRLARALRDRLDNESVQDCKTVFDFKSVSFPCPLLFMLLLGKEGPHGTGHQVCDEMILTLQGACNLELFKSRSPAYSNHSVLIL